MSENPCKDIKPREGIRITVELYEQLLERSKWLECLEAAGLDNWDGTDYAHELLERYED